MRILQLAVISGLIAAGYVLWTDHLLSEDFESRAWDVPAQVLAKPLVLTGDGALSRERVLFELEALGYRRGSGTAAGEYRDLGERLLIHSRGHAFFDGIEPPRRMSLTFSGGVLSGIRDGSGREVARARLEPVEIGRIFPQHHQDRAPLKLQDTPVSLQQAVLAAEDRSFFEHHGVDPRAVARAAWANLRERRIAQGGSTLSQQLIKNLYLDAERSWTRKLREALLALLLERRYSKPVILQAYMNQVFLGQDGDRAIHGFALAAEFYFGRPLSELSVDEHALLVALIKGPSYYDPRRHPERARERRNLVLSAMRDQGYLSPEAHARYARRPLRLADPASRAAGEQQEYLQLVKRQLARDYRGDELRTQGLRVYTGYDPYLQMLLDEAVASGLAEISKDPELQVAAVALDYTGGEVVALRGSRRALRGHFNRALDASRPIGSLVKPAVYLAALQQPERYFLHSPLLDAPVQVDTGSEVWTPGNYDRLAHGKVTLVSALSRSHNLATVRLGLELGLGRVKDTLKTLGLSGPLNDYPSLLLGAVESTPLEVAQLYQTLANDGRRLPPNTVRAVVAPDGRRLSRPQRPGDQVVDPVSSYLIQRALQEALVSGTARAARLADADVTPVGGKTGTTNDRRDSWFAGYAGKLLAVVWLGRDDNRSIALSGASGAARIWRRFMNSARPANRIREVPPGIEWYRVDQTGAVLLGGCSDRGGDWPYAAAAPPDGRDCRARHALWRFLTDLLP